MTDTTTNASAKHEELRTEIEQARKGFHDLLQSLSEEDFRKKSGNDAWSNGQLMWHMGRGVAYIPELVERSRNGKNLNLPRGVFDFINPWLTRWGSRGAKLNTVGQFYDEATEKALAVLGTVNDDEWDKTAVITGNEWSVEHHFRIPGEHFAEHKADILKSLGRS